MSNIISYGAVGDGKSMNTLAIQKAIDACAAAGGGKVVIPAGVFKTGTIWLKDHVELHLEAGATLLASDCFDDYNSEDAYEQNFGSVREEWRGLHLIIAHEVTNVAITGLGTIDGNCQAFVEDRFPGYGPYCWSYGITAVKDKEKLRPGQMICFIECKEITVTGVTLRNSPCWSCFFHGCQYVTVHGIKIHNPLNMLNSDGIDLDTCRMVTVSDCIIETGDDAITLRCDEKKLKNKEIHCEYVTITNCVFCTSASGIRVGVGEGEIRHVRVSNITARRSHVLIHIISSYFKNGCARIQDVNFSNISAVGIGRLFRITSGNDGFVKNVTLDNIRAGVDAMSVLMCDEDGLVENIALRNIELYAKDRYEDMTEEKVRARGHYILSAYNARQLLMDNIKVSGKFAQCDRVFVYAQCPEMQMERCNFEGIDLSGSEEERSCLLEEQE